MQIYWIALLMTVFISWMLTSRNVKCGCLQYGKVTFTRIAISFLPLYLVALFRWNVGVDVVYGTGYYFQEYTAIQAGQGNILGYEIGFYLLMEICNALHLNLYLFYCIVTTIFFVLFFKYLNENSKNIVLSAIIFFASDLYLFTFSTLRQSLGIAFFLYPLSEIINGRKFLKNWKWWACTITAISMHISILYLVIVLLFSKVRFRKKTVLYITILGCGLSPLIQLFLSKILSFTIYFKKYFGSNEFRTEFTPTYFLIALLIFLPVYFYYDKIIKEGENNYILVNVSAFLVVLMLNSQVLVMPYRIFPLFVPVYLILCSKLVASLNHTRTIRFFVCVYLVIPFLFLFINQYYIGGGSEAFAYKSIFQFMNQYGEL